MYQPATKTVTCLACADTAPAPPAPLFDGDAEQGQEQSLVVGHAGASARREYDRRRQKRADRIRARHPRLGGLILALSDDPHSTTAWARGARGEELLAGRLDAAAGAALRLLHDRRIPDTKANIDHLAITATGVYVTDAKRYQGKPQLQIDGGLLRPQVERLLVGRRDCTHLVSGVSRQVDVVRQLLATTHPEVPVHGVLCFVEADWPLIGGDFTTHDIHVMWPKKLETDPPPHRTHPHRDPQQRSHHVDGEA